MRGIRQLQGKVTRAMRMRGLVPAVRTSGGGVRHPQLRVEYGAANEEEDTWLVSTAPVAPSAAPSPSSCTCTCACVLPLRNSLQVLDHLSSAHSPLPTSPTSSTCPLAGAGADPSVITSPRCGACIPRIVMVPAVGCAQMGSVWNGGCVPSSAQMWCRVRWWAWAGAR
ncbi:hypothetical protein JB92DRAFT_2825587 [Gautieria morchelliformis]|nr:hypothetical protein JB92DRAFT_2825587 [Gautieria morchelliformis]